MKPQSHSGELIT